VLEALEVGLRGSPCHSAKMLFLLHRKTEGVLSHLLLQKKCVELDYENGSGRLAETDSGLSQKAGDENFL